MTTVRRWAGSSGHSPPATGPAAVEVIVEAGVDGSLVADGALVEVGIAPAEISAILRLGDLQRAQVVEIQESAAVFRGTVQPEAVGSYTGSACTS